VTPTELQAFVTWVAAICTAVGAALGDIVGHVVSDRKSKRDVKVAEVVAETSAQDKLIDQLQEELSRYRDDNDRRIGRLEDAVDELTPENRAYRAFIGVQRDHMAAHGIPLPPWPEGLPR
jgi:hypothetical protein